jgi:hypothetical protein
MKLVPLHLWFDPDGFLFVQGQDGKQIRIYHSDGPIRTQQILSSGRILAGCFLGDVGDGETGIYVDFISFTQQWIVQRWNVDSEGKCHTFIESELTRRRPIGSTYVISPDLIQLIKKQFNDFEIYSVLRMLIGIEKASEYLDSFIAAHNHDTSAPCRLVVIFNHNFSRNCKILYDFYSDQFPDIDFVMPCAAPNHQNYYSYPFGSFQFHGLIHGYLQDRIRTGHSNAVSYLFIQDDVLLHPRLNSVTVNKMLSDKCGAWFPFDARYTLEKDNWLWSLRIRNAFNKQRDPQVGNGFEGLQSTLSQQNLWHGVSDCFGIHSALVAEFINRLAPLVASNLFPELAIPTALFNSAEAMDMRVIKKEGTFLWQEQRKQVHDLSFIENFLASDSAFLHPVKIGGGDVTVLQAVKKWSHGNSFVAKS